MGKISGRTGAKELAAYVTSRPTMFEKHSWKWLQQIKKGKKAGRNGSHG